VTASPSVQPVGFGAIGANSFVANAAVLPAIEAAGNARLVATASRSGDVPHAWAATDVDSYEAVLDHPEVQAVYIPLPNGMHQEWTEKAASAGKHVLCEKPLASDPATAQAMAAFCTDAGVLLAEAWMTPFHERYATLIELTRAGVVGRTQRIDSRFTFTIGPDAADNYRWDPDQGGGALLDVGIYCLGPIVELFGPDVTSVAAHSIETARGVDASTRCELRWADGREASIHCSFVDDEAQTLVVTGTDGTIGAAAEAFTAGPTDREIELTPVDGHDTIHLSGANDAYQSMVEAFATAVTGGAEWPRPVERSIEMLQLIERIRHASNA
jgi:predicted dehydrogenase